MTIEDLTNTEFFLDLIDMSNLTKRELSALLQKLPYMKKVYIENHRIDPIKYPYIIPQRKC